MRWCRLLRSKRIVALIALLKRWHWLGHCVFRCGQEDWEEEEEETMHVRSRCDPEVYSRLQVVLRVSHLNYLTDGTMDRSISGQNVDCTFSKHLQNTTKPYTECFILLDASPNSSYPLHFEGHSRHTMNHSLRYG